MCVKSEDSTVQYSPKPYESVIKCLPIRQGISKQLLKKALSKIYRYKQIKLEQGNIAVISEGKCKVHYRVGTKTGGAKLPFYSIRGEKIKWIEDNNVNDVICLFFTPQEDSVHYIIWSSDDIKKEWNKNDNSDNPDNPLYRWNPQNYNEGDWHIMDLGGEWI